MAPRLDPGVLVFDIDLRLIDPRILAHPSPNLTSPQPSNYDHPPASERPASSHVPPRPTNPADISTSLQHLREVLDSDRVRDRDQRQRAMETLDRELLEMSAEPASARYDRRRRELEVQAQDPFRGNGDAYFTPPPNIDPDTIPTSHAPVLMRSQRRPTGPSNRLRRQIERATNSTPVPTISRIEQPTSIPTLPRRIGSPDIALQEYRGEAGFNHENRSNAKRRKLDFEGHWKRISYGHFGQVVPGSLQMELVSCDGGQHMKDPSQEYLPAYVLKDDEKVYRTNSNQANILIRHTGDMPFSLTKLVIKAPKNSYESAIQQGMVFISMAPDDVLERTEMYKVKYAARTHRHHHRQDPRISQMRPTPSQEYLNAARSPLRSLHHSFVSHPSSSSPFAENDSHSNDGPAIVPGFVVTNEYDERSDSLPSGQTRSSINGTAHEDYSTFFDWSHAGAGYHSSSDENTTDDDYEEDLDRQAPFPPAIQRHRGNVDRSRLTPNRIETGTTDPSTASVGVNPKDFDKSMEPLLAHAKFFIPKDRNMASVQFDPPV